MNTIAKTLAMVLLLAAVFAPAAWAQGIYTAADCNQSSVNAVINGPTHTAADGDVIQIPAGSCTWTSGITVPSGKAITITGTGTPTSDPAVMGASASCGNTSITVSSGIKAFRMTPAYGASTSRLSCMVLQPGSGGGIGISALGTCAAGGCPNLRMDNITFLGWAGHPNVGISYGINAIGDMFGVIDHNSIDGTANQYLQLVEQSNASYLGVGLYGDNSWAQPEAYGSGNFLFFENNSFSSAGCCENEGSAGGLQNEGGGRVVVRYNQYSNMDNINFSIGWHGSESSGRPRSTRAYEYYGNTYNCPATTCGTVVATRNGNGLVWGNTVSHPSASLNNFITMSLYRAEGNPSSTWGPCDGTSPWDTNDAGNPYWAGTISSASGNTITVSGASWTSNQWAPTGAPYSVHDVTKNSGAEIISNGSNTLTVRSSGGPGAYSPSTGDSIELTRATVCLDQAGRGAGILYNSVTPATPASSSNEALVPTYVWYNTINNGAPTWGVQGVNSSSGRVIRSRDFYVENINQAIQSSPTAPFDGTTTIGAGHGTLANRPTSCMVNTVYWATDQGNWNESGTGGQGQLFRCTTTNTWTLYYAPYTYPHPLTQGSTTSNVPKSPIGLQAVVN